MPAQRSETSRKREDIQVAAQRLFLQSGFSKTSMDAIAAEANVSKQTVYRYYGSKSQLFSGVLGQMAERLQADLLELQPQSSLTPTKLRATLITVAERILDRILDPTYLDLVRVVLAESREFPELPNLLRASVIERGANALSHLLESAQIAAVVEISDVRIVQRQFVGPLLSYLLEGLWGDPRETRQRASVEVPSLVELFMSAVSPPHQHGDEADPRLDS
ncbi:MAG: TetR/AcrR family transcriptional regulator [Rubrobacter sp.]|nr:TetR/AcrR family transcriptional regulator [Rubrobacter sp.]